ncbi:hypothetical protein CFP56_001030 [Quercus suber]|uniref:Uncharacterized protein n=1 Tax=Quercus suber TaxID=58331 RepID=A0AAW0LFV4_QUESU
MLRLVTITAWLAAACGFKINQMGSDLRIVVVGFSISKLGSNYNSFVTFVTICVDPLSLEDLHGHLLTHEVHLEKNQSAAKLTLAAANFANQGNSSRSGCGGRRTCPAHQPGHGSPSTNQKTS